MKLKFDFSGDAEARVKRAQEHFRGWVRTATGDVAKEGGEFIKEHYLRGQALQRITGRTHDSVKQFYVRSEQSWYIRPGVGIKGSLSYLARWIGTRREFMKPGFKRFLAERNAEREIIRKVEDKL